MMCNLMKAKQLLMKAKELREFLNGIPDDSKIFLKCDHGENFESGDLVVISRSEIVCILTNRLFKPFILGKIRYLGQF